MLRMFRTAMYGEATREENRTVRDVNGRETFVMALILASSFGSALRRSRSSSVISNDAAHKINILLSKSRRSRTCPSWHKGDLSTR
jgi:NADH:ubiquinone oxidoreductase subunit 4 (subunit M)